MFVNCGLPEFETRDSSCVKSCQTWRNKRLKRGRGPGHPSFEHGISRRQRKCWNACYSTCFFNFVSRTTIETRFGCESVWTCKMSIYISKEDISANMHNGCLPISDYYWYLWRLDHQPALRSENYCPWRCVISARNPFQRVGPKIHMSPEKGIFSKGKNIFQPATFRDFCWFFRGVIKWIFGQDWSIMVYPNRSTVWYMILESRLTVGVEKSWKSSCVFTQSIMSII